MAIVTTVAPQYFWKLIIIGVLCAVFSAWGVFDLMEITRTEEALKRLPQAQEIFELSEQKVAAGGSLTPNENELYEAASAHIDQWANEPAPSTFNQMTQWMYISMILCTPYLFWIAIRMKREIYTLDDDGTLHLPEIDEEWKQDDIADIDMGRWMAKSIAWVVHTDGQRVKLDAYKHKHLELVIGGIANRLHPDDWEANAKPVKAPVGDDELDSDEDPGTAAEAEPGETLDENPGDDDANNARAIEADGERRIGAEADHRIDAKSEPRIDAE